MTFEKMPRAGSFCIKLISIFLIPTFMLSNIVYAAPTTDSVKNQSQNLTVTNPEGIVIPREFGLVKTKFTGKDDRLVIHIQDAHCNYEAQSNIVKILETLHKNYNVSLVSVEGADGVIDTSWFKAFPDDEVRKEVADYFMKKGEITGPEFLSITTDYNIKLFGAETRSYYIDNLNAFTSSYPLKEQTEKYLNSIKSALNRLKTLIYSEDLKLMDAKYQDYDSKKLQFNDYVKFLQVEAEKAKINLRAYENFFKLVSVLVYEKKIDFTVTDKERSALIDFISKDMPKETLTELVNKSLEFKTGKISSADYYAYLKKLAIDSGTDLAKDYPNLYNYIIYNSVYSKIENEKLFNDIKKLEGDIKEKLFTTDDQRALEKLSRHIEILIGLVNIKLLNGDYEYFEANKAEFSHESFSDFIKKKTVQYGLAYEMDDPNDAVVKALPKLEDFYSIAIKRDKALVDNTLGQMGKDKARVAVLVTGGFHSEGMSKLLEKQGVSYMVICPSITKDLPTPYIQILTNQKTPLSDILVSPVHASEGQGVEKIEALAPPLRTELATMDDKELEAFLKAVKGSSDLEAAIEQLKNDWYKISVNGVSVGNVEVVKGYIEHMRNGVGGVSGSTTIIVDNMMKGLKANLDELEVSQAERAKIKAAIQKAVSQIPSLQSRMVQEASRVQAQKGRKSIGSNVTTTARNEGDGTGMEDGRRLAREAMGLDVDDADSMEAVLLADTDYGTAIKDDITRMRKEITAASLAGNSEKASKISAQLADYVKKTYAIMSRIDEARSVLTRPYKGFGVILISSTTPGEAAHQQEVVEKLLDGVKYDNKLLGNKVCVLSVCDESEGGQIVGQENTWKKAADEAFGKWCAKNNLKPSKSLAQLVKDGDVSIATFHNGGKGERFATAGLAFNLSRADQPLIWTMPNAKGEQIDVTLLQAIILTVSAIAEKSEKGREVELWANQTLLSTLLEFSMKNYQLDKLAVAVPQDAQGKDLFDYGTFIVDENGKIIKFLANKVLTIKTAEGKYVRNPKYGKDYDELVKAAKEGRAFFDYGSFSMSQKMAEALHDYWTNVKHIFDIMSQNNNQADKPRDIDPKFIQIIVPLANGLESKVLPEGLPEVSTLRSALPSKEKSELMDKVYQNLLKVMEPKFAEALNNIYIKDKDGVYDAIEFFLLNREGVFKDLSRVVGYMDLGPDSLWFAYKRLLDMANEKFLLLSDINGTVFELGAKGEVITLRKESEPWDRLKSVAARRLRGIKAENVASFELMGKAVTLSAAEVKDGVFITISGDKKNTRGPATDGVWVKGSLIKGNTVLLPGSSIEYSVINDSQGLIVADHSYLESTTTSKSIKAKNSILIKIIDETGLDVAGKALADAYRQKTDKNPTGKIRMETLPGYDPKPGYNTYDNAKKNKIEIENEDGIKTVLAIDAQFNVIDPLGKVVGRYHKAIAKLDHPAFAAKNTVWYETTANKDISVTLKGQPATMTVETKNVAPVEGTLYADSLELVQDHGLPANIEKALKGMLEQGPYYGDATGKFLARPESDAVRFGNNTMSFYEIRKLDCDRVENDRIENRLRAVALLRMRLASASAVSPSDEYAMSMWINAYINGELKDLSDLEVYAQAFGVDLAKAEAVLSVFDAQTLNSVNLAISTFDAYGKANPIVSKKDVNSAKENIIIWMTRPDLAKDYSPAIKALVELASKNTEARKELFDSFYKIIKFGTGGRRGKVGIGCNRINPYMIALTAQGHTNYLLNKYENAPVSWKKRGVVIGYDTRDFRKFFKPTMSTTGIPEYLDIMKTHLAGLMKDEFGKTVGLVGDEAKGTRGFDSKMLSLIAAQVYAANGIHAYVFDEARSTPETSFVTRRIHGILSTPGTDGDERAVAGVVMSSSHNQPDNNGSKFYEEDGGQAPPYLAQQIVNSGNSVKHIERFDAKTMAGLITWVAGDNLNKLGNIYAMHSKEEGDKLRKIKDESARKRSVVAFHAMNGTGDTTIAKALVADGYTPGQNLLTDTQDTHSYEFGTAYNNTPNPEVDQSFDAVIDIGMKYDRDWLGGKVMSLTRRGFTVNTQGMTTAERKAVQKKLLECQVALTTDPDADRVGTALKRIDELPNGDLKVRWVTANDNDEAGIILFRYVIDRWLEIGEIKDNEIPFAVTTAVSSKLEARVAQAIALKYKKDIKVLRHPVGFKYTGEAVTFINNRKYHDPAESVKHPGIIERIMSGSDSKKGQLGVPESDLGRLKFILSFEEGEGGLVAANGAADKDSGVIGIVIATLAEEMLSQGKTVYDYLLDIYKEFGYSKSYLEPIVLDGAEGNSMIAKIQAALKSDYYALKADPSAVPTLKEIAGQRVDWKNSRYHLDDYKTKVETEQESLDIMELLLGDEGTIVVKDKNGKDVILKDVTVLIRPSGTEPKSKIWCYVGSEPLPANATAQDLKDRMQLIDEWNRKILDAALIFAYKQTGASYAGYSVEKLSPAQQTELLRTDFNTALSTKLGIYFPMMEKVKNYVTDIKAGKISFIDARKEIEGMTKKFSSAEKENLIKTSVGVNLQNQWNSGIIEDDILMQAKLIFGDDRVSSKEMGKAEKVVEILRIINSPDYVSKVGEVDLKARSLFGDVEGEIFVLNVLAQKNVVMKSVGVIKDQIETSAPATPSTMPKPGRFEVSPSTGSEDLLESVPSIINVKEELNNLFNLGEFVSESELLRNFDVEANRYLKSYSKITNKDDIKRYFRLVAERALNIDDIETSRGLQIMAGQALAIISLIEDRVPGADKVRININPTEMLKSKDKDRGLSYIDEQSVINSGIGIADVEGAAQGMYWRGVEGITKLGVTLNNNGTRVAKVGPNISADAIYDKEKFASQSPKMVMYVMLHVGGYHTTVFLHDYIPGTIQHTSTGAGHMQNDAMDIKYVVSGSGLQLNKVNVSVIAQRLEKGGWAVAYPNNIDEIVNFGGLVFKDFSFKVPGVASQTLTATVPYYAVTVNDQEVFVANGENSPSLTYSAITAPVGSVSIRDFYVYSDAERLRDMPGDTMSTEKPVIVTPEQVARAAQTVKIAEAAQPIISRPTDSPVLKKYAWAGTGISRLLGMAVQKVAEIWFNSTQKDGVSKVPGTDVALAEAVTTNPERMLGPGMTTKPVFNKILGKDESQPQIVHIGFNSKIGNGQQFIGLMIREREAVRALLQEISKYKTTQDSFDLDFKAPYERWVSAEIRVGWRTLVIPEFPNNIIEKLDAIRKIRAELVSYMNEVKLEPGQVIISPVGYIHSIVGSHQTHPLMNPTETNKPHPQAKNEAWYIISDGQGGMLYFEPQQTSNTTYSPFDFPTPIVWDAAKNAPNVRKDFLNDKKEIENLKALLRPGESLPADEEGVIRLMAERTMKFEATTPEDFIVNDRVMDATPEYGNPVRTTVERLIHGSYPVMETPPFNLERISLTGGGVNSPASIKDSPIKDSFHELTVVKGEVVVVIEGKEEVLPAGSTVFVPAANKTPIEIKSNGEAEVLKTYPGKVQKTEMTAAEIIETENKETGHIRYLLDTLRSQQAKEMIKSLDADDGFIVNVFDTNVEEARGTVQAAQALVEQEAGSRVINIRGTGDALRKETQRVVTSKGDRIRALVATTSDNALEAFVNVELKSKLNKTAATVVLNVERMRDKKDRYIPVPGLQNLAMNVAIASVVYRDKATGEYSEEGARFVLYSLDRIALNPNNKPFTLKDVMKQFAAGVFKILPRIMPVDLAAAREAYIAAKAALQSL